MSKIITKKCLIFWCRNQEYIVNDKGQITSIENAFIKHERIGNDQFVRIFREENFSNSWILLGGTKHHWTKNHLDVTFRDIWANPHSFIDCYVWDRDHDTTRSWGGGEEIRVMSAYVNNIYFEVKNGNNK